MVSALEAIAVQYCLFSTDSDYGCFLLAALLLRAPQMTECPRTTGAVVSALLWAARARWTSRKQHAA